MGGVCPEVEEVGREEGEVWWAIGGRARATLTQGGRGKRGPTGVVVGGGSAVWSSCPGVDRGWRG